MEFNIQILSKEDFNDSHPYELVVPPTD
jgi:hypothetical protein